jgi:hypothetical protein
MSKFEVGDTVSVTTKWGVTRGTVTVEKVLKTRIVLSNGERYDLDGYFLGGNNRGSARHITLVSRGH